MYTDTILLVEDNPDDELLALRALKKTNATEKVVVARDGEEALAYVFGEGKYEARNPAKLPRVIFLDINLPKINGLQVLEKIRLNKKTSLVPIVLLTSSDEERDMIDGYKLGANSYINKPVNFNQFIEEISLLGKYWLGVNKTPAQ